MLVHRMHGRSFQLGLTTCSSCCSMNSCLGIGRSMFVYLLYAVIIMLVRPNLVFRQIAHQIVGYLMFVPMIRL
jgi:hypothetical protein